MDHLSEFLGLVTGIYPEKHDVGTNTLFEPVGPKSFRR